MNVPLPDPMELATPAGTARVLRAFHIRPRKRFGQHFLVSRRVLDRLLEEAAPSATDRLLEIGAGLGTLTAALGAAGASVTAVEVDDRLMPILRATTARFPNVRIVHGDVMRMNLGEVVGEGAGTLKIAANLPYGIASPLLIRALESLPTLERAVVTIQSEVAERILAKPGSKTYGALTVAIRYRAEAARVMRVPPGAFFPPPEVDSAVIRLTVLSRPRVAVADERLFVTVVRAAFGQRRKVLRNALAGIRPGDGPPLGGAEVEDACARAHIDPRRRGETLSVEEFAALADALKRRETRDGDGWNGPGPGTTHLAASGGW